MQKGSQRVEKPSHSVSVLRGYSRMSNSLRKS